MKTINKQEVKKDIILKEQILKEELKVLQFLKEELKQYDYMVLNNRIVNKIKKEKGTQFILDDYLFSDIKIFKYVYSNRSITYNNNIYYYPNSSFDIRIYINDDNRVIYDKTVKHINKQIDKNQEKLKSLEDLKNNIDRVIKRQEDIFQELKEYNNYIDSMDNKTHILYNYKYKNRIGY